MDIKQEDLIKFWTWFGFRRRLSASENPHYWQHINGYAISELPEITLNNIYEYAIPKLQDKGLRTVLEAFEQSWFQVYIVKLDDTFAANERADNPTEALYKAISVVIDKETK